MSTPSDFERALMEMIHSSIPDLMGHSSDSSNSNSDSSPQPPPAFPQGRFVRVPPQSFMRMMNAGNSHAFGSDDIFSSTSSPSSLPFAFMSSSELPPGIPFPSFPFAPGGMGSNSFSTSFARMNRSANPGGSEEGNNDDDDIHIQISMERASGSRLLERMGDVESFLNEMLQQMNPDNSTSSSAIKQFEKVILCNETQTRYTNQFSIKQLKAFLAQTSIDCSRFIEKKEFISALTDSNHSFKTPSECFGDNDSHICTICAGDMTDGDLVTKLPCGHWFHYGHEVSEKSSRKRSSAGSNEVDDEQCQGVMRWLCKNSTCPTCRSSLPKERDVQAKLAKAEKDAADAASKELEESEVSSPDTVKRQRSS